MDIDELIDNIATKNFTSARQGFDDLMKDRVSDAMDAEKIKIAGQIYNGDDDFDPDEVTDETLEAAAEEEVADEDFEEEYDEDTE